MSAEIIEMVGAWNVYSIAARSATHHRVFPSTKSVTLRLPGCWVGVSSSDSAMASRGRYRPLGRNVNEARDGKRCIRTS